MSTQMLAYQQIHTLSDSRSDDATISHGTLAYFRGRLSNRIHELVLSEFATLEREGKTSRAELARNIRRKPEQITRWLGSSGNWTLDTVSDLLLGMGLELTLGVHSVTGETMWNVVPSWTMFLSKVNVQTYQEVAQDITLGNHQPLYFSIRPPEATSISSTTIEVKPSQALPQPSLNVPITIGKHEHANC